MIDIQLGQWVVVIDPGYVDSGVEPGYVGRLVVLDPGDLRPYGVEHPEGVTFTEEGCPSWRFFQAFVRCLWASVVRPASPEEVAKSQLASLEGL